MESSINYFISTNSFFSSSSVIPGNQLSICFSIMFNLFYYSTISTVYASYLLILRRRVCASPMPSCSDNVGFLKSWITMVTKILEVFSLLWIFWYSRYCCSFEVRMQWRSIIDYWEIGQPRDGEEFSLLCLIAGQLLIPLEGNNIKFSYNLFSIKGSLILILSLS